MESNHEAFKEAMVQKKEDALLAVFGNQDRPKNCNWRVSSVHFMIEIRKRFKSASVSSLIDSICHLLCAPDLFTSSFLHVQSEQRAALPQLLVFAVVLRPASCILRPASCVTLFIAFDNNTDIMINSSRVEERSWRSFINPLCS